ncbi:putative multidrug resistance-associated protein [Xylariaceae sp. FL0804]|nr:putative multidrug resistance-associated protein [Xylariaceae sp. FL0804]
MATCNDSSFGPRVNPLCRTFDFTLYFQDVVLVIIPTGILLLVLPWSYVSLVNSPRVVRRTKIAGVKALAFGLLCASLTAFAVVRAQDNALRTNASVASDVLSIFAALGAAYLSWLHHHRSIRPSSLLAVYLGISVLFGVVRLRSLWLTPRATAAAALFSVALLFTTLAFCVESVGKQAHLLSPQAYSSCGSEPFSGLWRRICYAWLTVTVRHGYRNILTVDDLPELDPEMMSPKLRLGLEQAWAKSDRNRRNSLIWACFRAYAAALRSAIIPRLCLSAFTFSQPFLISTLIDWIQNRHQPLNFGQALIGAYALDFLGMAAATAIYWYGTFRFLTHLRGGLISIIFRHTVELRAIETGSITGLTLMGTDVDRIMVGFRSIHEVWASLLEVAIAIYLLERQLGVASIVPGFIVLAFSLATFKLASWGKLSQKAWIERVEKRLSAVSHMLGNMKVVKMLGLNGQIYNSVDALQKAEVETSRVYRNNLVGQIFLSNAPSALAPAATFAVYVGISIATGDSSIVASTAFPSLALITLLTTSALTFIQSIPAIVQCLACFDRIQAYCNTRTNSSEGLKEPSIQSTENTMFEKDIQLPHIKSSAEVQRSVSEDPVIIFNEQSVGWKSTELDVIQSLNFSIVTGSITLVSGATATGKSTLLQAILGEASEIPGRTKRGFDKAAYCPQTPWITVGTIRDNIIGPYAFDEEWYTTVVDACGLQHDLSLLRGGDGTQLGSNGANISGGQRQRVSLARAIYSRCKLVLLDDVLSGVDALTSRSIEERLFGRNGIFKRHKTTVVVVTHSPALVSLADYVIMLQDGGAIQHGAAEFMRISSMSLLKRQTSPSQDTEPVSSDEGDASAHAHSRTQDETLQEPADEKEEPDQSRQNGDWSVFSFYAESAGWPETLLFLATMGLWSAAQNLSTVWLNWWSSKTFGGTDRMYLGVYFALAAASTIFIVSACWMLFIRMISNSMRTLHKGLLRTVLGATPYFFHDNDVGSITNRFSQDMELVGMDFPLVAANFSSAISNCLAQVVILAVYARYLAVATPFLAAVVYGIQRVYLRTSRQIRLLDIEAKAPLFLHFTEATRGSAVIRAFGWQHYSQRSLETLLDRSQRPNYLLFCVQQWLALLLDLVVTVVAVVLVTIVVSLRDSFDPSSVGVALVTVMSFNRVLMSVVKYWTMMETSIGAVSRLKQFSETTPQEERGGGRDAGLDLVGEPSIEWPTEGTVTFSGVSAAHKPQGSLVLGNVSVSIRQGEKVAICGRSGSGKTSFILSLLRMTYLQKGSIEIDGILVSAMDPEYIRQRVNVVPQEPFLITPGSLRSNLDPYHAASDESISRVLEAVGLLTRVEADRGGRGIDQELESDAWSVGEKQLLCLARAMVRKSKLLVLDEAMSSLDNDTETAMQNIVEREFSHCTVLSVMHRLSFISRYDKVLVLDGGAVVEFDTPQALLSRSGSWLSTTMSGGSSS